MATVRVLFIGGTGTISSACSALAASQGLDLTLLCRGRSDRSVDPNIRILTGDIHDSESVDAALGTRTFDVVVNWVAFTPQDVEADIARFLGRTGQYVFISSATVYQTPPPRLPIVESFPLANPVWAYAQAKIACEQRLNRAAEAQGFPVTIVRPSHTYDERTLPVRGGWTVIDRMRRGKPVVVHGDGTSLWVLTHHADFARGFVPLLGLDAAVGRAIHITSDDVLTWNAVFASLGRAAGVDPQLVHVPSEIIARKNAAWGESLLGDKAHSKIFDNTLIRTLVPGFTAVTPFDLGARDIVRWYDADPSRQHVDREFDALCDELIGEIEAVCATPSSRS